MWTRKFLLATVLVAAFSFAPAPARADEEPPTIVDNYQPQVRLAPGRDLFESAHVEQISLEEFRGASKLKGAARGPRSEEPSRVSRRKAHSKPNQ